MVLGDLDADGDGDLYLSYLDGGWTVYLNDGTGHMVEASHRRSAALYSEITSGDFDRDGRLDIIRGHDSGFTVFRSEGGGEFFASNANSSRVPGLSVEAIDFDDDGALDLVTSSDLQLLLYRNDGSGGFDAAPVPGGEVRWAVGGDLDADGDTDIVGTSGVWGPSQVGINDGSGQFEWSTIDTVSGRLVGVGLLDDDSIPDVVTVDSTETRIDSVLIYSRGHGDGTFSPMTEIDVGLRIDAATVFDADGDGDDDVGLQGRSAVVLSEAGDVFVQSLGERTWFPRGITAGDIDGDGQREFLLYSPADSRPGTVLVVSCAPR